MWFTLLWSIEPFCCCCWFLVSKWSTRLWKVWNISFKTYHMLSCSGKMTSLMSPLPRALLASFSSLFCLFISNLTKELFSAKKAVINVMFVLGYNYSSVLQITCLRDHECSSENTFLILPLKNVIWDLNIQPGTLKLALLVYHPHCLMDSLTFLLDNDSELIISHENKGVCGNMNHHVCLENTFRTNYS